MCKSIFRRYHKDFIKVVVRSYTNYKNMEVQLLSIFISKWYCQWFYFVILLMFGFVFFLCFYTRYF